MGTRPVRRIRRCTWRRALPRCGRDQVRTTGTTWRWTCLGRHIPLAGQPLVVVEDVARLGGFGIAAHPDSPKESLRWTDADAPIDGIEWLNGDSEWRNDSRARLWRAAAGYLFRPGPALTMLLIDRRRSIGGTT